MLSELCAEIRNYFIRSKADIHNGKFTINGGKIAPLDFLQNNQYFRIVGSVFNDGVYKNDEKLNLTDEVFEGSVWAMKIPPDFIALSDEIDKFNHKIEEIGAVSKGYASESFGGYSYTLSSSAPADLVEMEKKIKRKKNNYRRISVL